MEHSLMGLLDLLQQAENDERESIIADLEKKDFSEKEELTEILEYLKDSEFDEVGSAAACLMEFMENTNLPNKKNVINACDLTIIDFNEIDNLWKELKKMVKKL